MKVHIGFEEMKIVSDLCWSRFIDVVGGGGEWKSGCSGVKGDVMSESGGEACTHFSEDVYGEFLMIRNMKSKEAKITEPGKWEQLYMLMKM